MSLHERGYVAVVHLKTGRRGRPKKLFAAWDAYEGPSLTENESEASLFDSPEAATGFARSNFEQSTTAVEVREVEREVAR